MAATIVFQSTPAIAGGRILNADHRASLASLFQSTPAIAGGRISQGASPNPRPSCFNPRPPLLAGESRSCRGRCTGSGQFQSTPAIAGGRIHGMPQFRDPGGCFNPRPPLLAGESLRAGGARIRAGSFNPRPPLLAGESVQARDPGCVLFVFQSTPAIAGGRIGPAYQVAVGYVVSIHARHCWRANRSIPAQAVGLKKFQSTPAIAGGRIPSHVTPCQAMVFSGACANLAMPSCVCMKNHRNTIKNLIKTMCCEVREPTGKKPFTRGSRRSPYHGTGRAPPVTAPAGHQNPSP